jgi:hypothetical protein
MRTISTEKGLASQTSNFAHDNRLRLQSIRLAGLLGTDESRGPCAGHSEVPAVVVNWYLIMCMVPNAVIGKRHRGVPDLPKRPQPKRPDILGNVIQSCIARRIAGLRWLADEGANKTSRLISVDGKGQVGGSIHD